MAHIVIAGAKSLLGDGAAFVIGGVVLVGLFLYIVGKLVISRTEKPLVQINAAVGAASRRNAP